MSSSRIREPALEIERAVIEAIEKHKSSTIGKYKKKNIALAISGVCTLGFVRPK